MLYGVASSGGTGKPLGDERGMLEGTKLTKQVGMLLKNKPREQAVGVMGRAEPSPKLGREPQTAGRTEGQKGPQKGKQTR
jgi:hypothetical protein